METRLPLELVPSAESMTGTAAPTEIPSRRGKASSNCMAPVTERACTIPTAAEADCRRAVKRAPTRIPRIGFDRDVSTLVNQGCSFSPLTAPLMVLIPTIRTTKPIRISPTCLVEFFLLTVRSRMPMTATTPVRVAVDRSFARPLPESR